MERCACCFRFWMHGQLKTYVMFCGRRYLKHYLLCFNHRPKIEQSVKLAIHIRSEPYRQMEPGRIFNHYKMDCHSMWLGPMEHWFGAIMIGQLWEWKDRDPVVVDCLWFVNLSNFVIVVSDLYDPLTLGCGEWPYRNGASSSSEWSWTTSCEQVW